jgi:hypothetical protein
VTVGAKVIVFATAFVALVLVAPAWADFDDGVAAYNLGDYAAAIAQWRPLADTGNATAQYNMGVLFEFGLGLPADPSEAARWYRLGAEQGNAFAQKALGVLYYTGRGVAKDNAEAVRWYRAAAEQDFAEAQFNLGMTYARGEGIGQDRIAAVDERVTKWMDPARKADLIPPQIEIADTFQAQSQTFEISGLVADVSKISSLTVHNIPVTLADDGAFAATVYVPLDGVTVSISAIDEWGNRSERSVLITRHQEVAKVALRFDALNPTVRTGISRPDAFAIVIGVEKYESMPDATYANRDAQMFFDFAQLALGVPVENIRILVDEEATDIAIYRTFRQWLPALVQPGKTDVYLFFAGHGLATPDGSEMFLLPHNVAMDVLNRTAIRRSEIFDWLRDSGARSITIFLDTCFSGGTRGDETLVADARGFGLSARDETVPTSFTLISAASGAQTSTSLPEAQQGLFSYFLMKGMEGAADANNDRQITAGELHAFVAQNVARQASRLATDQAPQIAGDSERVLVAW